MAYDEKAGERLRRAIGRRPGLSESAMFGGLTFLLRGNMCCGIAGDELVVRVDRDRSLELARRKHARLCDITGKPMRGLVQVKNEGFRTAASLRRWVDEAVEHTSRLPAKVKAKAKAGKKASSRSRR